MLGGCISAGGCRVEEGRGTSQAPYVVMRTGCDTECLLWKGSSPPGSFLDIEFDAGEVVQSRAASQLVAEPLTNNGILSYLLAFLQHETACWAPIREHARQHEASASPDT